MYCYNCLNHKFWNLIEQCKKKKVVQPSLCDLKFKHIWVMQQGNDPGYTSKPSDEWLNKKGGIHLFMFKLLCECAFLFVIKALYR